MTIDHRPLSYEVGPLTITGFGLAVLAAFVVGGASGAVYLGITATMGVSEARALVDRARRLLPG